MHWFELVMADMNAEVCSLIQKHPMLPFFSAFAPTGPHGSHSSWGYHNYSLCKDCSGVIIIVHCVKTVVGVV